MVKSVLGVNHQGLRDWIVQRVSAIIMALYSLFFIAYIIFHPSLSFSEWRAFFDCTAIKVATVLFLLSLLCHAWIGMWTIFTDYVKPFVIRAILNVLVLVMLFACFVWGLMILWSV